MTAKSRTGTRRVAVITGTRAEYGLLTSTISAIHRHPSLKLQLVATGMHLLRKFGHTVDDIARDGWTIDAEIPMQTGADSRLDQARGLARGVAGIAAYLDQAKSDIVLVLGDRIEALAGTLAAVITGRILAHVHGGDIAPGDLDDSIRHAISKLAHLHFPATASARRRLLRMGESPSRIHVVGAPGLDRLFELLHETSAGRGSDEFGPHDSFSPNHRAQRVFPLTKEGQRGVGKKSTIPPTKRILILQHPCGRSAAQEERVMGRILRAVDQCDADAVCIYPNSDPGHTGIVAAIRKWHSQCGNAKVFRSLDRDAFLRELIRADVLVGNSSSGVIEAPAAGVRSINVGPRQQGRESGGRSVTHVAEGGPAIRKALAFAFSRRPISKARNAIGDGKSGQRVADLLARIPLADSIRRKVNSY